MKSFMLLISLVSILTACEKEKMETSAEKITMRVNYYRQSCQGEGVYNCYLVQEGKQVGTNNWNFFYNEIEGFDYKEGFIYTLKVRVEKVTNPPADGSNRKYILIKILAKEKKG